MTVSQLRRCLEDIPGGHEVRVEFPGQGSVMVENARHSPPGGIVVTLLTALAPRRQTEPPKPPVDRLAEALSDLIEQKMPSAYAIADAMVDQLWERGKAERGEN